MEKTEISQDWDRAKKMAFWDQGKLTYQNWLKDFKAKKHNVLTQSVNYMRPSDLIGLLGQKEFIKSWPVIRELEVFNGNKKAILDAAWSFFMVGDVSFPVNTYAATFHPKKRETLRAIVQSQEGQSIYSIAKLAGRNPRRVYDDVHDFADKGIVVLKEGLHNGKKTLIPRVIGCHIY
jgi:hypothetical protein